MLTFSNTISAEFERKNDIRLLKMYISKGFL